MMKKIYGIYLEVTVPESADLDRAGLQRVAWAWANSLHDDGGIETYNLMVSEVRTLAGPNDSGSDTTPAA